MSPAAERPIADKNSFLSIAIIFLWVNSFLSLNEIIAFLKPRLLKKRMKYHPAFIPKKSRSIF